MITRDWKFGNKSILHLFMALPQYAENGGGADMQSVVVGGSWEMSWLFSDDTAGRLK